MPSTKFWRNLSKLINSDYAFISLLRSGHSSAASAFFDLFSPILVAINLSERGIMQIYTRPLNMWPPWIRLISARVLNLLFQRYSSARYVNMWLNDVYRQMANCRYFCDRAVEQNIRVTFFEPESIQFASSFNGWNPYVGDMERTWDKCCWIHVSTNWIWQSKKGQWLQSCTELSRVNSVEMLAKHMVCLLPYWFDINTRPLAHSNEQHHSRQPQWPKIVFFLISIKQFH